MHGRYDGSVITARISSANGMQFSRQDDEMMIITLHSLVESVHKVAHIQFYRYHLAAT